MKRIERALQQNDGPVCVYLMLMESKLHALKQQQRRSTDLLRQKGGSGGWEQEPQVRVDIYCG